MFTTYTVVEILPLSRFQEANQKVTVAILRLPQVLKYPIRALDDKQHYDLMWPRYSYVISEENFATNDI